ncbi:PREDICTED: 39S ribosomal protein L54, mitochondrial [Nicrophorus vespilloides]|uniref:Large ribosomal subunit protein mL54 n=1 Tax=Nicrophorus vespilloides TaxID=110193 RepID=A0ABM1MAR9_NICVS|nr:PREDICTED: 39S ribosomal protein L54, mitochondrial [Nicrophorus vespilloides]
MNISAFTLFRLRPFSLKFNLNFPCNNYAKKDSGGVSMVGGALKKKKMGKMGPAVEKKVLPVETDPKKLVSIVCGSNIFKTGEDVKIRPMEEYPDWLWNLRTGPAPPLEELDPESKQYWRKLKKLAMKRNNKLSQLKQF